MAYEVSEICLQDVEIETPLVKQILKHTKVAIVPWFCVQDLGMLMQPSWMPIPAQNWAPLVCNVIMTHCNSVRGFVKLPSDISERQIVCRWSYVSNWICSSCYWRTVEAWCTTARLSCCLVAFRRSSLRWHSRSSVRWLNEHGQLFQD